MRVEEFDYVMPEELIANSPLKQRDVSKLMVLDKKNNDITHTYFNKLPSFLRKGDVLLLNNTRVIPARLFGSKKKTGGKLEVVILYPIDGHKDTWEALVKPGKKAKVGSKFIFGEGLLEAEILDVKDEGTRIIKFEYEGDRFQDILEKLGKIPLPPYIKKELDEPERYQTVYAKNQGSVAAPTAGLHFTEELLNKIRGQGVQVLELTLHVGLGTFRPVKVENIKEHEMHSEFYYLPDGSANIINEAKENNQRIVAVGTTVVRTLESCASDKGLVKGHKGWTDLFIYPGYRFKIVDAMVTNFHLPKSTLLMLVSAFAGKDFIMNAYQEAIDKKYRFYSFGDAMFIH
ncbi:tRNA preQ1(34) S-adenosylmethionine ribosyltransferase-isomerase QueA [Natranaerofaba carboxydovora]|uniref:tRNA preQ1(34) S-adenosylmethionine ribosyltransferase-isomerase QueA n=1 Tax=Natranaerofaba carboxydovora TaxID=2742683 RepID=UPI001F146B7D|nr:tRNA preQ1(34) S-adenosylmethionine ribosyltransferase-isomerase QueA [Natranaerofaba carboxydovora]UMZ74019.1 S-adenosylmethionine:tRNA ribosyltransferase-isomerase [Natranaerofaba carboxydovora]